MSKNDLDLSFATIVSIYPLDLKENKPGLYPSEYIIPKGTKEKPGLCIVSNDVHHLMDSQPLAEKAVYIKVNAKAIEAAQSIITDWTNSLIEVEAEAMPGLFAIRGDYYDPFEVVKKFAKELDFWADVQYKWFVNIVGDGDTIWRTTKSVQGISDLHRIAAQALDVDREWRINITENRKCPFCKNDIKEGAIKCLSCGEILDQEMYNRLRGVKAESAKVTNPLAKA